MNVALAATAGAAVAEPAPSADAAVKSPQTNGALVRFVGRHRIKDGWLATVVTSAMAVLVPVMAYMLCRARCARSSWREVFFQLFSVGIPPASPAALPESPPPGSMRFVCVSDTHMEHGMLPTLPAGDVLVHCGDFTNFGSRGEVEAFAAWMGAQPHATKVVVPGNHDMILDSVYYDEYWGDWSRTKESTAAAKACFSAAGVRLLMDESIEVGGLRLHGSPWVTRYAAWRTAFNKTDAEMEAHWQSLPESVDVLLTHMPPRGFKDREPDGAHAGCPHLARRVAELRPKFHVFGHVHSDCGMLTDPATGTTFVNAASVCDLYRVGSRAAHVFDVRPGAQQAGAT